ncbi:hypothetical protein PILCRDRAFT_8260 [Piloderma croceum F 1598]|uniref:Uncharacterized protein n=1 Tax=Piloderma croceum (strain F 1598) TaxID=765440 RepID=A0A0C3B6Z2_PILCF|nr:hypothetical protein PILCRDRAFT_8260 [Piloderma croceum F 1598]
MAGQYTLPSEYHYILFSVSPPCDALAIRKALQDSLAQSFGVTSSNTYLDILWVADPGVAAVVRASQPDAVKIMASVVASTSSPRISVIEDSAFLPSLLANDNTI